MSIADQLTDAEAYELLHDWQLWARPGQMVPKSTWSYWLILAGRGWGKTRTGSEWVRQKIKTCRYTNLIGATVDDARDIMIEGESGILAICPKGERPRYVGRKLIWPNGAKSLIFTADEPDRLRGKQHEALWCLTGDTMVLMGDGSQKKIRDVRAGDFVQTRKGPRIVTGQALTKQNAEIYLLKTMGGRAIVGTAEHPVFVPGHGFIPIGKLKRGMPLYVMPCITTDSILCVEKLATRADVYDIAVDGEREFFANGILVHNCDEIAAWRYAESWTQAQMGLRLGNYPQACITTTPRPTKLIKEIVEDESTVVTTGTTYDNKENLAPAFFAKIINRYEGTRLGRQELMAELLKDNPNALWQRARIDELRVVIAPAMKRIVVAIDPAVTSKPDSDWSGIIVVGLGIDDHGYVLQDGSVQASPDKWCQAAVNLYHKWQADRIVAEVNNGGDLVETVLRTVDKNVAYTGIHASRGKITRAEPIAALYEQGKFHHVGSFSTLEDEMAEYDPLTSKKSPDRMDALVWAATNLFDTSTTGLLDHYS